MFGPEDVQALAETHAEIRDQIEHDHPRKAAKLVCKALTRLCDDNGSFWESVGEASAKTADEREERKGQVLDNILVFIEDEGRILRALGVEDAVADPILSHVYTMIELTRGADPSLTYKTVKLLREQTREAAKLVCENLKGRFRKSLDWVFSVKGLKVIGGATIASANSIAILSPGVIAPHIAPVLIPKLAGIGKISIGTGLAMMGFELKTIPNAAAEAAKAPR